MTTPLKSKDIDMSPEAIRRRLEEIRALYKLGQYLLQAKLVGPATNRE